MVQAIKKCENFICHIVVVKKFAFNMANNRIQAYKVFCLLKVVCISLKLFNNKRSMTTKTCKKITI